MLGARDKYEQVAGQAHPGDVVLDGAGPDLVALEDVRRVVVAGMERVLDGVLIDDPREPMRQGFEDARGDNPQRLDRLGPPRIFLLCRSDPATIAAPNEPPEPSVGG